MNTTKLNNIEKYLNYLLEQIAVDYQQNTDDQYDENILFWNNQYAKICDTLCIICHNYGIDINKVYLETNDFLDIGTEMIKAIRAKACNL